MNPAEGTTRKGERQGWSPFRLSQVGPFYVITVVPFSIDIHTSGALAQG